MTEEYVEQMGWEIEPYTEEELIELHTQACEPNCLCTECQMKEQ